MQLSACNRLSRLPTGHHDPAHRLTRARCDCNNLVIANHVPDWRAVTIDGTGQFDERCTVHLADSSRARRRAAVGRSRKCGVLGGYYRPKHCIDSLADDTRRTWTFNTAVTSLATRAQGGFVGTITDGFAWLDLENGTIEPIALPEAHMPNNRFNDGKIDRTGRYWAGSMHTRLS